MTVETGTQMETVAHGCCHPHAAGMMDVLVCPGHLPTQLLRHSTVGKNSNNWLEPRRLLLLHGGKQEYLHSSSFRKDV